MKILVILGSGGHTAQMLKLVDLLGERFEYAYLISMEDRLSLKKIKVRGEVCFAHRARAYEDNIIVTLFKIARLFVEAFLIIVRSKPKAIVSAGPGIAVPVSILGKLIRKKVIYIESWSRVYRGSMSGRILYRFADLFFIQWPDLKVVYPRAVYAGRLS